MKDMLKTVTPRPTKTFVLQKGIKIFCGGYKDKNIWDIQISSYSERDLNARANPCWRIDKWTNQEMENQIGQQKQWYPESKTRTVTSRIDKNRSKWHQGQRQEQCFQGLITRIQWPQGQRQEHYFQGWLTRIQWHEGQRQEQWHFFFRNKDKNTVA